MPKRKHPKKFMQEATLERGDEAKSLQWNTVRFYACRRSSHRSAQRPTMSEKRMSHRIVGSFAMGAISVKDDSAPRTEGVGACWAT